MSHYVYKQFFVRIEIQTQTTIYNPCFFHDRKYRNLEDEIVTTRTFESGFTIHSFEM